MAQHTFSYDTSQGGTLFVDPDGDPLSYAMSFVAGGDWINVSGTTLAGTPPAEEFFEVWLRVSDGRGGEVLDTFRVRIWPNGAPIAAAPGGPQRVTAGAHVNYDASAGGAAFTEPDGDKLTYEVAAESPMLGLSIDGTRVIGSMAGVGAVNFRITARDPYGASAEQRFAIVVAAPEPGKPVLPASSYVYEDDRLALPPLFITSRGGNGPFWDMTPPYNPTTNAGATLGRVLFYDKRLSITNTLACASCHLQGHGFAKPERFSTGLTGQPLKRNTMGLTNVRYNLRNKYFADERAHLLESLVLMPIEEPTELGNRLPLLVSKLQATDFYPALFAAAFGDGQVTSERIALALSQFLRSILSFRSKFDAAFSGTTPGAPAVDPATVLTAEELRGAALFNDDAGARCATCHLSAVQLMDAPDNNGLDAVVTDPGIARGVFRTASLRNVAATAPYMHDGRFATLREVIDHYDHGVQESPNLAGRLRLEDGHPRRLGLTEAEKDALEAFLRTLTDDTILTDARFSDPFR